MMKLVPERVDFKVRAIALEGVGCGQYADEDEHYESHALLSIIRAVGKTHPGAGEHEESADPARWGMMSIRCRVELGVLDEDLHHDQ